MVYYNTKNSTSTDSEIPFSVIYRFTDVYTGQVIQVKAIYYNGDMGTAIDFVDFNNGDTVQCFNSSTECSALKPNKTKKKKIGNPKNGVPLKRRDLKY